MIPQFDQIRIQALKTLKSGAVMRAKDFRVPLAEHFHLTDEEMNAWYPSGNGEIFLDRISWALSYLFIAGLVEKPKRGDYKISDKGLSMLESCSDEQISEYIKTTVNARTPKKESKIKDTLEEASETTGENEPTPQESLYNSYDNIKQSIQSEILTTILSKKPQEFERLVVRLLQAMGYGGEVKNSGFVTKFSNDGGIDGIIKEDLYTAYYAVSGKEEIVADRDVEIPGMEKEAVSEKDVAVEPETNVEVVNPDNNQNEIGRQKEQADSARKQQTDLDGIGIPEPHNSPDVNVVRVGESMTDVTDKSEFVETRETEPVDKAGWIVSRILELGGYENVSDSVKADIFGFDIADVSGSIRLFSDVMKRLGIKQNGAELYEEFQKIYDESVSRDADKEKTEDSMRKKERTR